MKYKRFEDLPCWRDAIQLARKVYALTRKPFFRQSGDLTDQLRRASLSVSNNIAEGFERGSTAELLAYLYIARGSAGEVRSMLHFAEALLEDENTDSTPSEISNFKSQISDIKPEITLLKKLAEGCSRQIRAWANSLQNSDIKGQRHLTDKSRRIYKNEQEAAAFKLQLKRDLHKSKPDIYPDPDAKIN